MQGRVADASTLGSGGGGVSNADPGSEHNCSTINALGAAHPGGKRQKTGQGRGQRGGGVDSTTRKRKRLLTDAEKISTEAHSLKSFLELVTSVQAKEILKRQDILCDNNQASPPHRFVGELLAHLLRLLPRAAASLDGASTFIECLEPFEDLDDFVLPAYFYRAIAAAKEPPPPRGHNWKRKNDRSGMGTASSSLRSSSQVTGLQTVRAYLCMNGKDAVECGRRTVVTTLTRALLGSWDGSVLMGRELFDQSVLMNPDRSGPVGLGLEVLLQCLVQEDGVFSEAQEAKDAIDGEDNRSISDDDDEDDDDDSSDDTDTAAPSHTSRPRRRGTLRAAKPRPSTASTTTAALAAAADETRACVTIVGNYVRACGETSASFFRDILPKVLLMGMAGGGGGGGQRRRGAGSRRIPRRLAAFLRSLVESTRSRSSFNLERMVVHTVQEVKSWGDPAAVLSAPGEDEDDGDDLSVLHDDVSVGRTESGGAAKPSKNGGGVGTGDKPRRRGLVLACLDVLGPTEACLSLIRREMVDGETKAALRSAVPDGLLEYRRTCDTADADGVEAVLLGALSSLVEDSLLGVRCSAVAAVGEGCPSDCASAASLLLKRCLDTAPKVRALAIRLLVDEFRLGIGAAGASLARAVLLPPSDPGHHQTGSAMTEPSARSGGGGGDGRFQESADGSTPLLGELLHHRKTLEETDRERFPRLLRGLVDAVMRGDTPFGGHSATNGGPTAAADGSGAGSGGDGTPDGVIGGAPPSGVSTSAKDPTVDPWRDGGGSWEDLAAPAARLWAACRPSGPAQLERLDEVIGDVFSRGAAR